MIASKSKWCHGLALHATESTIALSIGVMIFYWPFEYENFKRDYYKQHLKENYEYANAFTIHTFPFISSALNIICCKVVFLKRDAKIPFIIELVYLVVCYYGKYFYGHSVYWNTEFTDWSYPPYVFGINLI